MLTEDLFQCNYKLGLKKGESINKHVERTLPSEKIVHMGTTDYKDVKIIVLRPFLQMDVALFIRTKEQFLATLSIEVFRDQSYDSPLHVMPVGNHPFCMLPPMTQDNLDYEIHLKSTLSRNHYDYTLPSVIFNANVSYRHLEMEFNPTFKSVDAEISRGTIFAFVLFLIGLMVTFNYKTVEPLFIKLIQVISTYLANTRKRMNKYNASSGNESANTAIMNEAPTVRKRFKLRKT